LLRRKLLPLAAGLWLAVAGPAQAQPADDAASASRPPAVLSPRAGSAASAARAATGVAVPRLTGRLRAADIGLVINTLDPTSGPIGEHYIAARGLAPAQVLRVSLPYKQDLSLEDFERLRAAIAAHFGPATQALALAWTMPYAVGCNSITAALTLGLDGDLCRQTCNPSRPSRYFNSATARPFTDLGLRPTMLLAGRTVEQTKALIDRGVAADGSLLLRGRPPVNAMFLTTNDPARRVRAALYPEPGLLRGFGVEIKVVPAGELAGTPRVLMALTGSERVVLDPAMDWVPGGLGDHLTSSGGDLYGNHHQTTALAWLDSGATGSHGTVSEPCNHLQKFPHPQVLLGHYLQGATLIEAYWKSVAWPQQSLFVGEPLAAPFAPPSPRR
jgi:uncharacterized protein (TIGR03790 family)